MEKTHAGPWLQLGGGGGFGLIEPQNEIRLVVFHFPQTNWSAVAVGATTHLTFASRKISFQFEMLGGEMKVGANGVGLWEEMRKRGWSVLVCMPSRLALSAHSL